MQDFMVRKSLLAHFLFYHSFATLMKGAFGEMDNNKNKVTDKNKEALLSNDLLRDLF